MTETPTHPSRPAERAARQAARSPALVLAARIGLVARGLLYALVGVLAAQVALGDHERADQKGALQKIAEQPFGRVVLWLMVVGFAGYGLWKVGESFWGHRELTDEKKRAVERVASFGGGLLYLGLGVVVLRMVTAGGSGATGSGWTARLLDAPAGQALVVAVGLVILGVGAAVTWRGLKTDFAQHLDLTRMTRRTYAAVRRLGQVGYVARGLVFGLVGVFVIKAAVDHDPRKASGLDVALKSVAAAPFGRFLLLVAAAGLICFGTYSLAEARYRRL